MRLIESRSSQNVETLPEQLRDLVENAKKIRVALYQQFKNELSREPVWLRPSVGGISVISCAVESPQLGFKIKRKHLERKVKKNWPPGPPKRPTPEKKLQSWLIRNALEADGRLKCFDEVLGGQYWFVSDEIALLNNSKKVVSDLLLVKVDAEGLACLVNVELKSARLMETFRQVIRFRDVLERPDLQRTWREFAEDMTGKKFQWHPSHETCGVVVWPAIRNETKRTLADERRKKYERVDLVGYRDISGYAFESE